MRAIFFLLPFAATSLNAQDGVLDLTELHDYATQGIPAYITKDNTPANNPITDLGATLGRVLFYDKKLSKNGSVSCASCHQQEHAFGDPATVSIGVAGTTGRHSMRLINSRFSNEGRFFWDERASSLEVQTSQPIQDHVEMGFSGEDGDPALSDLVTRIEAIESYKVLFTGVYGDPNVTEQRLQRALAQFVRSIQSFDSKYDAGRSQVNNDNAPFSNFTAQENTGKQIFFSPPPAGGAGCVACHQAPEFDIDPRSGHNGVIGAIGGGQDLTNTRSPSLRDLVDANGAPHGGFMHNASLVNLEEVVNHYSSIPAVTQGLDPRLAPGGRPQRLNLNVTQRAALVSFLRTLTGTSVYREPKWSSPFDENGELSLIILPSQLSSDLVNEGEVAMFEVTTTGVPNVTYLLRSSTNLQNWDEGLEIQADVNGHLSYRYPTGSEARFFKFVYEVQ